MVNRFKREDGFTLVELLVVILVIGILTAIAVPAFLNQRISAEDAVLKSDIKQIKLAYHQYSVKNPSVTVYPDMVLDWKNYDTSSPSNMDPAGIKPLLKLTPGSRFHVFDGSMYSHGYAPGTTIIIEAGRDGSSKPGYLSQRHIEAYKP